jgi:hypothetical protein
MFKKFKTGAKNLKNKIMAKPSTPGRSSNSADPDETTTSQVISSESTSSSPASAGDARVPPAKQLDPPKLSHMQQIIAEHNKNNAESSPEKLFYCSEKTIKALDAVVIRERTPEHPDLTSEEWVKRDMFEFLSRGELVLNKALREKKTEEIIIALAEKSSHYEGYKNDSVGDIKQQLIIFFENVVESMKADYAGTLMGKLCDVRTLTKQGNIQGIDIEKQAKALQVHYTQCIEKFNETEFKAHPTLFIGEGCRILNDYYCELLKLKYEKKNRFNEKPVQAALDNYFEHRKQLYEILAMIRTKQPDHIEPQRVMLMDKFKEFIKKTYAENQLHDKTLGISHGPSKWTRINAAHEMYLKHCNLPGEVMHSISDQVIEKLRYVNEADEELKTLKRHGLFFDYGKEPKADIYTPLNGLMPIKALQVDPTYSPSLNF